MSDRLLKWLDDNELKILSVLWLAFMAAYLGTSYAPPELVEHGAGRWLDGIVENNQSEFLQLLVASTLGLYYKRWTKDKLRTVHGMLLSGTVGRVERLSKALRQVADGPCLAVRTPGVDVPCVGRYDRDRQLSGGGSRADRLMCPRCQAILALRDGI